MGPTATEPLWLRSTQIGGLDQLGVQVVSIALYSELLPGLTNVTDRVRYYSFYPWVLHHYAKDVRRASAQTWQEYLRRAEFLLALVTRAHHHDGTEGGEAAVGSIQAGKALDQLRRNPTAQQPISTWSFLPGQREGDPYFRNKQGGFGQYYRVTLGDLGLINFTDEEPGCQLVREVGTALAEICDRQEGRKEFWQAVTADRVSFSEVRRLGEHLCLCALPSFPEERDFLRRMLFGVAGQTNPNTRRRSDSLRLLLSFLNQCSGGDEPWHSFRQTAYSGRDGDGKTLTHPATLKRAAQRWATYQAGEYVNRSLEEMLLALLSRLKNGSVRTERLVADTTNEAFALSSKDLGLGERNAPWASRTVMDILSEAAAGHGGAVGWTNSPWVEARLLSRAIGEADPAKKTALGVACILSVLARGAFPADPYSDFETLGAGVRDRYPVNLASVATFVRDCLGEPVAAVVATLLREKVLFQHLRVAMRKLRSQGQATFKFVVEDDAYVWVEDFEPTFTSPRLRPAFLFLRDLGLSEGRAGNWCLTADGRGFLEPTDGR